MDIQINKATKKSKIIQEFLHKKQFAELLKLLKKTMRNFQMS